MKKVSDRRLPLYLSAPHSCSYLPGKQSSTLFLDPDQALDMATYSELLQFGFRRSGGVVYAPRCENCTQCISVRIPVEQFKPRRNHRRVLLANQDVVIKEREASFNVDHYTLYQKYTGVRHEDGDMASATPASYLDFLRAHWSETRFLEFSWGRKIVAVAVTDVATDGLSAVYTFYDPDMPQRSLGTFAILQQIARARDAGLPYLYLGYWIRDSRKMAYKTAFRPIELFFEGRWRHVRPGEQLPC